MAAGKVIIETQIDTKKFDMQIKEVEDKLNDIKSTIQAGEEDSTLFSGTEMAEMRVEAEKLENKLIDLRKASNKTTEDSTKGFEKGIKSLRRFALSLFSIRSAYSLISKASSTYLQHNEETANKIEGLWISLGNTIGPVIEYLVDLMYKGIGYLNEFAKSLTGIDYIAEANAKAIEKQAKAQNKLNKATQQYDFDVIRTEASTTSSSSSGVSGFLEMPKLNDNIVSKLQETAKWLKDNEEIIKAVGIALGLTFGATQMKKLFSNIGTLIGKKGTGLIGLSSLLEGLATIGIIAIGVDLVYKGITGRSLKEDIAEIKNGFEEINELEKNNISISRTYRDSLDKNSTELRNLARENKLSEDQYKRWITVCGKASETALEQYNMLADRLSIWGILTGHNKELEEQMREYAAALEITIDDYEYLYNAGKLNVEETENYKKALEDAIKMNSSLGEDVEELQLKYAKFTGKPYEIKITAKDETGSVFSKIAQSIKSVGLGLGGGFSKLIDKLFKGGTSGGRFATGGIITQPTRALIGEAGYNEYVLPEREDYLSRLASLISQYGGSGGGTTNVYLNGRLLQKEISRTESKNNFAANR